MKGFLQDALAFLMVAIVVSLVGWFGYSLGFKDGIVEGQRLSRWHNGIKGI